MTGFPSSAKVREEGAFERGAHIRNWVSVSNACQSR